MTAEVRFPRFVQQLLDDELVFRPAPPGDTDAAGNPRLELPPTTCEVDATEAELETMLGALRSAVLPQSVVHAALDAAHADASLREPVRIGDPVGAHGPDLAAHWEAQLSTVHGLDHLALVAVQLVDRAQQLLLTAEPLSQIRFRLSPRAKVALALGWVAMSRRGFFPLPPRGRMLLDEIKRTPRGAMHFVSASDLDAGYRYTMGIALSPEAQARRSMDVGFGLDGELIVPGQAVSPIPPFLALATRLFAASVATSSNISEEEQSIPMRNFPHPTAIDDLEPRRGGRIKPPTRPRNTDEAITDLRVQLSRYRAQTQHRQAEREGRTQGRTRRAELEHLAEAQGPAVGAAYDVSAMTTREIVATLRPVLADPVLAVQKDLIALYLDVEAAKGDRVTQVCAVIDAARQLGLRLVAVADQEEDAWLPNLLEYLDADELTAIADYADMVGVVVVDGRPVDPLYTAATAAQRVQSVYSTLSVDILKMGMWLCLDALTARKVWREIVSNPHIPDRMLLMPIGIVEPWSAFLDNRDPTRTARPILDPFEKIKFMIEEAAVLGIPSLLTDTRHKSTWVLLGRRGPQDEPHRREHFVTDPATGEILGRRPDSAIPLLSWDQFMECERLARAAGVFLGQAGSIETSQAFRIISAVTRDAAHDRREPATGFWTAETERVLYLGGESVAADLQQERSADVSAFLAVINRGFESHAKLDGWLRYLADIGRGDGELRLDLDNRREQLDRLLAACLDAQRHDPASYQRRWDAFRTAYLAYHGRIRDNIDRVRADVARAWSEAAVSAGSAAALA